MHYSDACSTSQRSTLMPAFRLFCMRLTCVVTEAVVLDAEVYALSSLMAEDIASEPPSLSPAALPCC